MEDAELNVMLSNAIYILVDNTTEHVMAGDDYARQRGHMLTKSNQAMW